MQTLAQFIAKRGITLSLAPGKRPETGEWGDGARHYSATLSNPWFGEVTVPFHTGAAWTREPTVEDVLGCLASDAACVDDPNVRFEQWAEDLGYDPDSRKAEGIYRACVAVRDDLRTFLGGAEALHELLYETEGN